MKRAHFTAKLAVAFFALAMGRATNADAAIFCVNSPGAIASALSSAASNGASDEIRILAGSYVTPGFDYSSSEPFAITISGGWLPGCDHGFAGDTSTLDGDHQAGALQIHAAAEDAEVQLGRLVFVNGAAGALGGGLYVSSGGSIRIEDCAFYLNQAQYAGGVYASATGSIVIRNNVFFGNSALAEGAGVLQYGFEAFVTGNTVVANSATGPDDDGTGGLHLAGDGALIFANNLLWNNGLFDVYNDVPNATFLHNDFAHLFGDQPGPASEANYDVEPEFAPGLLNLHLAAGSALVNAGIDDPDGGIGNLDFDGAARRQGAHVDIGAYETDVLFFGGFQTLPVPG
ncbi:MAG TPA: right-handed parallel beta-helix repeat-containing protein [Rhodanobacteraceae bacterium]|nr:right-handed parallel beta-helix repeat-containing protein [Rhodanobacteraceae bacterium]